MKPLIFFVGLITAFGLLAQDRPSNAIDLEQFAERMFQVQDSDINYEDIYESLLLYYTDPLNLNRATGDELASLYILSPTQVLAFVEHRDNFGELLSIYELQAITGFDLSIIQDLIPFVTVKENEQDNRPLIKRIFSEPNNYFLLRYSRTVENQRGYMEETVNGYIGSQDKMYGRFRVSHRDDFSAGFTFEKDAGERVNFNQGSGFDFYSAHLMVENQGIFRKLIVGDYQLQVGQGLVFGSGFNPGKGAETVNTVKRNTLGIRPYTSVLETGFFRGVGATVPFGEVEVTTFYSNLMQDGNVQNDSISNDFEEFLSSIQNSGFHRTSSELSSRNEVKEESFGGVVNFRPNRKLQIGASALNTNYSTALQKKSAPYNVFEFEGKQNLVTGLFASYQWQNFNFFGEGARSSSGGMGGIAGFVSSLSPTLDMAMSLRNYKKDFHSFYGLAFGEGSRNINERGLYWGIKYHPSRRYEVAAYYDKFSFPWLRFGIDAPSEGAEWLGRFTYRPNRDISTFVQVREERKEFSLTNENLSSLERRIKRNYIFNIDYRLNARFSMKSRVQSSTLDEAGNFTKGYAIIQDVNFETERFKISTRMALFETDDYDNRQYVYERDVLYAFSIPAYNGQGIRNYILLQYKMNSVINLWLRYGRFSYTDREVVGSGLDESNGSNRTEIKWMARVKF
ncbi:MAG: helix-hairpin-helix domain-containing protein [Cytophagales bacterium]|nr:helix-hairpin-helix domain-containing protein [Cytophagales bacterium]